MVSIDKGATSMTLVPGKIALVTGAGSGIGRATAVKFAQEGARVVVSDVDGKGCEETVAMIKRAGGEAVAFVGDVSKTDDVEAMVSFAVSTYGRLDCACNGAGIEGRIAPLVDQSDEDFDRVMAVNLRGVFLCLRAEIREMLKTGGGTIVNISSVGGLTGTPGFVAYIASKHGVNGLTKNAALEYAKKNIRVNSVCPGGIATPMLESIFDQVLPRDASGARLPAPTHPIGRVGTPEEVANLIVWLCSPSASFMTGAHVPIDGGHTAQ